MRSVYTVYAQFGAAAKEAEIERIAIIGAGSIGTAWAIVFAMAGLETQVHDSDAARLAKSGEEVRQRLGDLDRAGGLSESVDTSAGRIAYHESLARAVKGASYIQECITEDVAAKRQLLSRLEPLIGEETIIASSSSFIPASRWSDQSPLASRCLIVHPGNPPYLLRVVEVVPSPATDEAVTARALDLMAAAGMAPIRVGREIDGFVFNRLQGALLREAYALVRDGVATPNEIDRVVRDGLGLRWSVVGPFETVDLNTRGGIGAHAERMLPAYLSMGAERGESEPAATAAAIATVTAERRAKLPLEDWAERVAWRDRELMALIKHRRTREI